jgi:RNA polymerase sigma-70 factor (ECF subfamily)
MRAARSAQVRDDRFLVAGARDGDVDMFTELYHRHANHVFARLTRLVGPVPEREDLLQHIFLDVHRALPQFRGDAAFTTFLYRIVVNVAYDHLDRQRRRPTEPLDEAALATLLAPNSSPEQRVQQQEELALLFGLLGRLKPKKRIAFMLVVVEEMSYEEAAAIVEAEAAAVKQRVLAARRELDALLARHAEGRG